MHNIASLPQLHEALGVLGYQATLSDTAVTVKVGGLAKPFTAIVTHNALNKHFQFTCQVATLGQIPEDKVPHFAVAALDANNRIVPFAYALISAEDDPKLTNPKTWPVVLIHAVPIGDYSLNELAASMNSLLSALIDSRKLVEFVNAKK
jgi:hypothetical protein